jgi:hypothetical protein
LIAKKRWLSLALVRNKVSSRKIIRQVTCALRSGRKKALPSWTRNFLWQEYLYSRGWRSKRRYGHGRLLGWNSETQSSSSEEKKESQKEAEP